MPAILRLAFLPDAARYLTELHISHAANERLEKAIFAWDHPGPSGPTSLQQIAEAARKMPSKVPKGMIGACPAFFLWS